MENQMNQLTQPPVLYFIAALAILLYITALANGLEKVLVKKR